MGGFASIATLGLNAALAHRSQRKEAKAERRDADRDVAAIEAETAAQEREADRALASSLARQRARAGASGIGATGGSIDAVMRGLSADNRAEDEDRAAAAARRAEDIRSASGKRRRTSLLDLSTRIIGRGASSLGSARSYDRSLLD